MNKKLKISLIVLTCVAVLLAGMFAIFHDRSGWETTEEGLTYYLDSRGDRMVSWQQVDGKWYYFDPSQDGRMVTGWLELEGNRYYLNDDGSRASGWLDLPEGRFYFSPTSGAAATGWQNIDGGRYYLAEDGCMATGWVELDKRYYLNADGTAYVGWLEEDGNSYFLDGSGAVTTGWVDTSEGRCYLDAETGAAATGWLELEGERYYFLDSGYLARGWTETDLGLCYLNDNGQPTVGWLDVGEDRYYFDETGIQALGWQEIEGVTYYFLEDGRMARGQVTLEDGNYHFASNGAYVVLVNKWNPVPEGYEVNLVTYKGWEIDASCYDAFVAMMTDLEATGYYYKITSAYRSEATQEYIWNKRYNAYIAAGYSKEGALAEVEQSVAVPGTSEHHLGLAIDITGDNAKAWLQEHCWEYGFIVRYPEGKTDITGIIYEPWHYRYVGVELAMELRDSGLCLEEYMAMLTEEPAAEETEEE